MCGVLSVSKWALPRSPWTLQPTGNKAQEGQSEALCLGLGEYGYLVLVFEAVPIRRLRLWGEVSLTVRLKKGLWRLKVPNGCSHSFVTWFTKVCYHRGSPERRLYSVLVLCWVQVFFFFNLVLCNGLREEGDKFTRCLSALVRVGCIWRSQIWIIGVSMCKHCRALGNLDLGENVLLGRFLL